jgi:hypothetical protein
MKGNLLRILLIQMAVVTSLVSFASTSVNFNSDAFLRVYSDTGLLADVKANAESAVNESASGSLVRFDATYGKNSFELIWNTVSEKGFHHFDIERSLDGINFKKIGEVKGIGACSRKDNFFFSDNLRPATGRKNDFYYRLKQVETNGQTVCSKILIARIYNSKSLSAISVTPDPGLNDILVNVQLKENSYVVMKVTDKSGNRLIQKSTHGNIGFNVYKLDETSHLKPGTYSLEVIVNSNERMSMKLLKS